MKYNPENKNVFRIFSCFIATQILKQINPTIQLSIHYQNLKYVRGIMIMLIFFRSGIAISIGREK